MLVYLEIEVEHTEKAEIDSISKVNKAVSDHLEAIEAQIEEVTELGDARCVRSSVWTKRLKGLK